MSDHFEDWVGRSVKREDVATTRLLNEYRRTMSPHLHKPKQSDICPPGLHWAIAPAIPEVSETGPDGAEAKGLFLPPIPLPRRMWAGGNIETVRPIMLGKQLQRTSTISAIKHRNGAAGELYIVSVDHDIADDDGLVIRERQDLVFREGAPKTVMASGPAIPASPADLVWTIDPSPLMLFRFSAITFNGHRIHYDRPYAAEEGYPGLVVHGPLQAALLLNQLTTTMGHVPRSFNYRCVAPLFDGNLFTVETRPDNKIISARVVRHDGVTTAEGQALVQET